MHYTTDVQITLTSRYDCVLQSGFPWLTLECHRYWSCSGPGPRSRTLLMDDSDWKR